MAPLRHEVTGPGGRTLAVVEDGDPRGVAVLAHHGTPASGLLDEAWARDARERGIRLIGYDRPGYGGSTRDPGRDVAAAAADAAALADALGVERFATWGTSGGGPHALACAALLPERCAAAATLAAAAPFDAPGLDFLAGMAEDNVAEFTAALQGASALREMLEQFADAIGGSRPDALAEGMGDLLGAGDAAALSGPLGRFLHASMLAGLAGGVDGWLDDDLAFVRPWGFDVAAIAVPVQLWQGELDRMVPYAHGRWLAGRIPGVDAQLSATEGHLTLLDQRVGEVHAWLLGRF